MSLPIASKTYPAIHVKIHELESMLADALNSTPKEAENRLNALNHAHDILIHYVAEWVRCAEARLK